MPISLIWAMHAALSDLKMTEKILDMKLLNILQDFGSGYSLHSAQDEMPLSRQQDRTLHQVAF
jgi:hypothetical protein